MNLQKTIIDTSFKSFKITFRACDDVFRVWFMTKFCFDHVNRWKFDMWSICKNDKTFFVCKNHDVITIYWYKNCGELTTWLIKSIISLNRAKWDEIDDKKIEFKEFEVLFALKTCGKQDFESKRAWRDVLCYCFENNKNRIVNCMM